MTTACAATTSEKPFEGVIPNMERRHKETDSSWIREDLERYQAQSPCDVCHGYRLKPEALCVKIAGKHIGEVCATVRSRGGPLVCRHWMRKSRRNSVKSPPVS